jgi:hypothetical protein
MFIRVIEFITFVTCIAAPAVAANDSNTVESSVYVPASYLLSFQGDYLVLKVQLSQEMLIVLRVVRMLAVRSHKCILSVCLQSLLG